jgi:hypothetical protein
MVDEGINAAAKQFVFCHRNLSERPDGGIRAA